MFHQTRQPRGQARYQNQLHHSRVSLGLILLRNYGLNCLQRLPVNRRDLPMSDIIQGLQKPDMEPLPLH